MPYNIAIIGAGPAGCTLARLVTRKAGVAVTIFEAEESINFRAQGGTLDLRRDGGLAAIKAAGLQDAFERDARYDGEALMIADKHLKAWVRVRETGVKNSTSRPEIDRRLLRQLLYDSLPQGTVLWNRKLNNVTRDETGRATLHFADRRTAEGFDLVVGADGAWSKVRAALTDVKPHYYGIYYLSMVISEAQSRHPDLYKLVNRGSVFTYSDGKSITAQYMSDGSLHCGLSAVRTEHWLEDKGLSLDQPAQLREVLLDEYTDWDPLLRKIIQVADDESWQSRALYMLPLDHRWTHQRGITLIGDASHLMTPYAGVGVNVAMHDAVKLSQAIAAAESAGGTPEQLDQHLQTFEKDMFVRMAAAQRISWENCYDMFFVPGAPRAKIQEYIGRIVEYEWPPWGALARPFIRAGFGVLKLFR
ncbi:tetracycline resistance protein from transposon [Mycena haematopus]|nr:tetracycline resistance protein from transposon [Mycena haematopus]